MVDRFHSLSQPWNYLTLITSPLGIRRDGGYAEYANLRRECLCYVPEDLDPAEAAPLLCAGLTAFSQCLSHSENL